MSRPIDLGTEKGRAEARRAAAKLFPNLFPPGFMPPCRRCDGSGRIPYAGVRAARPCPRCRGTGIA